MSDEIKSIVGRHPNPSSFGLDWGELEGFFREHEALADQYGGIVKEAQDLADLAEEKKRHLPQARAEAVRKGVEETATVELKQLEDRAARLEGRGNDIKRAAELVEKDLQAALMANRPAYFEHVKQMGDHARTQTESLRAELAQAEQDVATSEAFKKYLSKIWQSTGGLKWMGAPAPYHAPSINNLQERHQRPRPESKTGRGERIAIGRQGRIRGHTEADSQPRGGALRAGSTRARGYVPHQEPASRRKGSRRRNAPARTPGASAEP